MSFIKIRVFVVIVTITIIANLYGSLSMGKASSEHFTSNSTFNPHSSSMRQGLNTCPHMTDEETEAQELKTCPSFIH